MTHPLILLRATPGEKRQLPEFPPRIELKLKPSLNSNRRLKL